MQRAGVRAGTERLGSAHDDNGLVVVLLIFGRKSVELATQIVYDLFGGYTAYLQAQKMLFAYLDRRSTTP